VSHAALRELTFVEYVVKEALRLHPPLFLLVRVAQQDFQFKQWFIPAGTWILVSPTVAHRMPEVFKDPEAFDPDRFAPPREEDKRDFAYIAFGGGRHKCLGNAFAILQIKAILALLLGQYEFELAGDPIDSDFHGLVVGPKLPCRMRYRRRAQPSVTIAGAAALSRLADDLGQAAGATATADGSAPGAVGSCPVPHAAAAPTATRLTIALDRDLCQGHAVCVGEAPDVFRIGRDGRVEAITVEPPAALHEKVRNAAAYCPTRANKLSETKAE
jgi:sterol 14-demethylase